MWGSHRESIQLWFEKAAKTRLIERLWSKDPTLWTKDATQYADIVSRLGWLEAPSRMQKKVTELNAFRDEIVQEGITHAVLLGMGGSSLAPQLFQEFFGNAPGHPALIVLDSTDPAQVLGIEKRVDLSKTVFIVSSKSGGTIELLSFFKYFYDRVSAAGAAEPGKHFIAITDPDTPLEALAKEKSFRRVFFGDPDVGGRFSALTAFGLVPAALIGADISKILDSAEKMAAQCKQPVPADNPAAVLGIAMAVLAEEGRDKLTLLSAPGLYPFGDWAEQLVAESTGKEGMGVVPVVREAPQAADYYGEDRFFVRLRTSDDGLDENVKALEGAGHPTLTLSMKAKEDVGGEFFRWEMATAIACALMKINAFDQPDVQAAKDRAKTLLKNIGPGSPMAVRSSKLSLTDLWKSKRPGDYAALLAFLPDDADFQKKLADCRLDISRKTRLAVTVGFGPRYLHSTGQLHKGGPSTGLFLLFTAQPAEDLPVPGEKYTFGQLELAQAMGDFAALEESGGRCLHMRLDSAAPADLEKALAEIRDSL